MAQPNRLRCATPELTNEQLRALDQKARMAFTLKQANYAFSTLTYVPVRPHLFRSLLGSGGMDLAKLNRALAAANRYYLLNGSGIQFYFAGSVPDYIDNDVYNLAFALNLEEVIVAGHDANNAINLYMVNAFDDATLGGYAYFPSNVLTSTRLFIVNEADEDDLGNRLLPHELGHIFNLYHTFQGSTSATPELVTRGPGANCATAGDLICDTPADPYGRTGASTTNSNGCAQYNGTATDPQGATYNPSITNLMSYYFPCTHNFTPGQFDRMAGGLALRQSHTAYSLTYPPGNVPAPANLVASLSANAKTVTLTWVDQASNEMGYFVERSTSPSGGFGPVGGTGPNQTTFTDAAVQPNVTYYYRVKPSNTTTGSFSQPVSIAVPICRPTYSASCGTSNGIARVAVNGVVLSSGSGCSAAGYASFTNPAVTVGAGQTVPVSATLLNASTSLYAAVWADLNRNGYYEAGERLASRTSASSGPLALSISLPVSLTAGALPMRLVTATTSLNDACGSYTGGETEDYVLTVGTLVECPTPTALTALNVTSTSAQIGWSAASGPTVFGLQYRVAGTPTWSIVNVASNAYSLTGLAAGTAYEWQALSVCGASGSSLLSPVASLTTPCSMPDNPVTTAIYANSAQLNWGNANTNYRLQWRPTSSPTWATVSNVTNNTYGMSGLSLMTGYQWQVAAVCPSGVVSAFAGPITFTTSDVLMYCQPGTTDGCAEGDGLASFRLGDTMLSTNSGCGTNAYQSFTTVSASLIPGQPYAFTATLLNSSWPEGLAVWVDLNRNGTLEATERLYASPGTATGSLLGTLTIPVGTAPGRYLLRARISYDDVSTDACAPVEFGETEDYLINVCTPPSATLVGSQTITSGQAATLTAQLTGGAPWSLTLSNGTSFSAIGTSPFAFTVSPAVSTTYTVLRVSNGCGVTTGSNGIAAVSVSSPQLLTTDLSLAMSSNTRTPMTGGIVTLMAVVTNEGPLSASGIVATCLLPPYLTFVGSAQAAVTSVGGSLSIAVGTLLPTTSGTFSFSVQVRQAGQYQIAAQLAAASLPDPDSFLNSGTSDGDDDMAVVYLRTLEPGDSIYASANPNPRPLPAVQGNQPAPLATEADISLSLWVNQRVVTSGSVISLSVAVTNRGALIATNVIVQLQLPVGWVVTNTAGLAVNGQVVTLTVPSIVVGQWTNGGIPIRVSGTGDQTVTGLITAATQPDSDSPHNNAFGRGEDDEAAITVRVW